MASRLKIRVLGGGWYGSHISLALLEAGHEVELHESADRLFAGASGANPARLHCGAHYPRSRLTRAACQDHAEAFMKRYGFLTHNVPINIYAIAKDNSLVDFGTYTQVLHNEIEFVTIDKPEEFGLENVEGAILTGERHINILQAKKYFEEKLANIVHYNTPAGDVDDSDWDATIDCTFCALDNEAVDRYEPCVTALVRGPTDKAITIMDGPFPSLYPWNEAISINSLTSASHTPLSKTCRTWEEAKDILDNASKAELQETCQRMEAQLIYYWPDLNYRYSLVAWRTAIRAMPKSAADARLVDVVRIGKRCLRVRAGKIDAIFRAEALIKEALCLPSLEYGPKSPSN